jgi:hypothetical protein
VVVAPPLRAALDGRLEVNLGVPANASVGDVLETLFSLYPRLRQHLAGDVPPTGGRFLQLALDEASFREWVAGGSGLSAGRRLYLFSLSRPLPGGQADRDG